MLQEVVEPRIGPEQRARQGLDSAGLGRSIEPRRCHPAARQKRSLVERTIRRQQTSQGARLRIRLRARKSPQSALRRQDPPTIERAFIVYVSLSAPAASHRAPDLDIHPIHARQPPDDGPAQTTARLPGAQHAKKALAY
jgi:hypothetical protein